MKNLVLAALLAIFLFPSDIQAQNMKGTEFWCAFMENINPQFNGPPSFDFQIVTYGAASGTVEVPSTGFSVDWSASEAGITTVELPEADWYTLVSETATNKGIKVTSDEPVSVLAHHFRIFFSESSPLYPTESLGASYLVLASIDAQESSPSQLVICATADNTVLEIVPSALTSGLRPAGVAFEVVLNEGQSYQIQAASDLSGTTIESQNDIPFAVFSGARQATPSTEFCGGASSTSADNHLWEQLPPTANWGTDYFYIPFAENGGDIVRIIAETSDTFVSLNCDENYTIDESGALELFLTEPTLIHADKRILVSQTNRSQDCHAGDSGDPTMLFLQPVSARNDALRWSTYTFDELGNENDAHHINLLTNLAGTENISLDGADISAEFAYVGFGDWHYAQIQVPEGTHEILCPAGAQACAYGFGFYDAYAMALGSSFAIDLPTQGANIDSPMALEQVCIDQPYTFSIDNNSLGQSEVEWQLPDGTTSNAPSFEETYATMGNYSYTVFYTTAFGCEVNTSFAVSVENCETNIPDDFGKCYAENINSDILLSGGLSDLTFSKFQNQVFGVVQQFTVWDSSGKIVTATRDLSSVSVDHLPTGTTVYTMEVEGCQPLRGKIVKFE